MRRILCCLLCLSLLVIPVRAAEPAPYVALTFDDGPSGRFTRRLLDGLAQRDARATFFLCGYRIREYPQETARILEEGHEIGFHGFSHRSMGQMSRRDIAAELADTKALLPEGCRIHFLRPPGGCCSENVRQVAQAMKLGICGWSVDPRDWATDDAAAVESEVLSKVADGDIVLLHDMSDSSVNAALDIIDALQLRGFRFVTVSELAAMRTDKVAPGRTYSAFHR